MTTAQTPISTIRRDIQAMQTLIRIMHSTHVDPSEILDRETDLANLYAELNAHPES